MHPDSSPVALSLYDKDAAYSSSGMVLSCTVSSLPLNTPHNMRRLIRKLTCSPCIPWISSFKHAFTNLCCLIVLRPLNLGDEMRMA